MGRSQWHKADCEQGAGLLQQYSIDVVAVVAESGSGRESMESETRASRSMPSSSSSVLLSLKKRMKN